ncbi:ion transporter [Luteolibacter sp. AS25]|uniref:ion transporter n=1 Tax=Luteolibacter sp. AS25 TaxID=3135776 RepID=UPI00398B366E
MRGCSRDEKGRISFGKWEFFIQALIVGSLIGFAVETLPNLPERWHSILRIFEIATVAIFTVEYFLRILLGRPKLSYIFSFYGIIDLLAIFPFYISTGIDLRSVRAFRLLRLFRLLKLVRYSAAIRRFHLAFSIAKEELALFGAAALIVLYLSALGIYYFERDQQPEAFASVFHSFWWAVTTLTTVGYGDVYPISVGGKAFTFFVLIIGLEIVAVPTGLFASALSKAREQLDKEKNRCDFDS